MQNILIVIPAYEPDDKLIKLVNDIYEKTANIQDIHISVVIVDDGSGDKYLNIFQTIRAKAINEPKYDVHIISYKINRGKGYALKTALNYLATAYEKKEYVVITMDSDGQHTVEDAFGLHDKVIEEPDTLWLGSRKQSKASPLRSRFGNAVTRNVFKLATGVNIYDTQTGLRAFSQKLMPYMLKIPGERYEYEMNVLLELPDKGIKIKEIPIETIYINDNAGSHFNAIKDSWKIYKQIFRYISKIFIPFISVSFMSFLIDYFLFAGLITGLKLNVLPANIGARIVSASFNFYMNRKIVFKSDKSVLKSGMQYALLAIFVLICNTTLLTLFNKYSNVNVLILKFIVECIIFILSFTIQKIFIFRK